MKMLLRLFALLLVVLLPTAVMADTLSADSVEAFSELLSQCRESKTDAFVVKMPAALGKQLTADNNALLDQLAEQAGVQSYAVRVSRNTQMNFTNVTYAAVLPTACATREEVREAITAFLPGTEGELVMACPEELFRSLFNQGEIHRLLTEMGIESADIKGNNKGHIFLSNVQMMNVPYACVSSVSEAGEKIAAWREQHVPAFKLIFDMDTYAALTRDDRSLMLYLGGVEDYRLSDYYAIGVLSYTEVAYSSVPGSYCTSEADVVAAIRAMGARGYTSFSLRLDQATYDTVYADRFARLYELQAQAGMTGGDLRYSGVSRTLIFDNARIHADVTVLPTLQEVTAYVEAAAQRGDREISMLIDPAVYADLMAGVDAFFVSDAKFYDLIANAGICGWDDVSFNRHAGAITLKGVQYYAGTNILRAVESGDLTALTAREQQALDAARALAADCTRATPAEVAMAIHDALCARITYVNDEATDEDDCCIGALLDGRANCDGYADAFLLVGRLAGLNIRYQHGDSLNGGMGSYFSTHMWNVIELDGSWRMVDVTWDDHGEAPYHLWFNIGEDRASLSHVWSREMTVPMLPVTDAADRPVAEYFAASEAEITAAAKAAQAAGHAAFEIYVAPESGLGMIPVREAALKGLYGSLRYTWIDSLMCLHIQLVP